MIKMFFLMEAKCWLTDRKVRLIISSHYTPGEDWSRRLGDSERLEEEEEEEEEEAVL